MDEIFTDKSLLPNQCVKLISVHFDHVLEVLEALRFEGFKVFSVFVVAHELAGQIHFLKVTLALEKKWRSYLNLKA